MLSRNVPFLRDWLSCFELQSVILKLRSSNFRGEFSLHRSVYWTCLSVYVHRNSISNYLKKKKERKEKESTDTKCEVFKHVTNWEEIEREREKSHGSTERKVNSSVYAFTQSERKVKKRKEEKPFVVLVCHLLYGGFTVRFIQPIHTSTHIHTADRHSWSRS